ncbi:MAG: hypothetical protein ACREAC_07655, partial [Blastocatellia bacterium]
MFGDVRPSTRAAAFNMLPPAGAGGMDKRRYYKHSSPHGALEFGHFGLGFGDSIEKSPPFLDKSDGFVYGKVGG